MKEMVSKKIYFGGDPDYIGIIKNYLKDDFILETVTDKKKADIVYWIYGPGPSLRVNPKFWLFNESKIIIHWIGTDVLVVTNKLKDKKFLTRLHYKLWRFFYKNRLGQGKLLSLAGSEWLAKELSEASITSKVLPLTSLKENNSISSQNNIIKKYDVISYVPTNRFDFYGGNTILKLAEQLNDISFLVIHPDKKEIPETMLINIPKNMKILPRKSINEMQELYAKSKCFLRLPEHDGLSLSVLEALYNKLTVFWTFSFPHTIYVNLENFEEIKLKLKDEIKNWEPNEEGYDFINKNYTTNTIKDNFSKIIKNFIIN